MNRQWNFLCCFSHSDKDRPLGICKIKVFPYTRKVAYQTTDDKGFSYIVKNAKVALNKELNMLKLNCQR